MAMLSQKAILQITPVEILRPILSPNPSAEDSGLVGTIAHISRAIGYELAAVTDDWGGTRPSAGTTDEAANHLVQARLQAASLTGKLGPLVRSLVGGAALCVAELVDIRANSGVRERLAFFNGTFVESFDALVTSDGATVTMSIEKAGGGDLTENFSSGQTTFDCTPAATIALTAGTDISPQNNFIYILASAPGVLVKNTAGWPSAEHNKIAFLSVPSASLVNTGASGNNFVYVNQNWNDNAAETATSQGHMSDMAERLRRLRASWFSGCQGLATQDGNDLWVSISTGVVYQLHPHTFAALDSDTAGAGDPILVVNDPDANYAIINSLNEITKHSDGDLIGNNKFVKFVLWGVANKTGEVSLMALNLPSEHYNTAAAARIDVEGYANFTIPAAFGLESSTGFLIAAFVCKHTATAMELQETIDLRGQTPTTAVGSGTGGGDVSALAALTDNAIVRGDGGAKDVQTSTATILDTGVMYIPAIGDGGLTNYDLCVGDVTGPTYGMMQMGNSAFGRTSYKVGAIDLDGTIICRNIGGPVTSEIEFIWTESTGGTARFALPKSAVGNATYNSRSMLIAGPAPADTDFVKVTYWQGQGLFHNLACDTVGQGADLGVQNDLEVEGTIFCDTLAESTAAAGLTLGSGLGADWDAGAFDIRLDEVGLLDSDQSHHLMLAVTSDLTAERTLSIATGNANRAIAFVGNPTLGNWFDQNVKVAASPTFAGVNLDDNAKIILGTDGDAEIYDDGTDLIIDPAALGSGGLSVLGPMGINSGIAANTLIKGVENGSDYTTLFSADHTYTGSATAIRCFKFTCINETTGISPSTTGVIGQANMLVDFVSGTSNTYGGDLGANISEKQTHATTHKLYGVRGLAAAAAGKAHTAGTFYLYSVFGTAPTPANGTVTSVEWAGYFDGDLQISSDKQLILEGSPTSKGDTYLVYDSAGTTLDFFLSGTEEMNIGVGEVNIVNELHLGGDLNHDGSNIGFFSTAPGAQAAAFTQTYSTVDRTLGAYTPDDESGAYTGIDNAQGGTPYAQLTDLNALRVAIENLRAFVEDGIQMLNAVVDDHQTYGLCA